MKVSYQWLSDFISIPWKPEELAERLTMAGIEIESLVQQGAGLDGVVVAEILKIDSHPNADRLTVCEVFTGDRKHQIVCGAKNHKVGDKVPLATPGCQLPNGMQIKVAKLRGVTSEGMLCSEVELGLSEDAEGLLILPKDVKVGVSFKEIYGLDDVIIDVEITPNRPDLLSHAGIAREIATLSGMELKLPKGFSGQPSGSETFPVEIKDPDLCPRYSARLLRDVKVGQSPAWMQKRLRAIGQRPINNVVDITNYVMLEVGQPLHAFDTSFLDGRKIIVRRAAPGERIVTLDEDDIELDVETLVIADGRKPVALAGVMGGIHSGIQPNTNEILLESATFKPANIRRTSKKYQIRSESSYRFERGIDPALAAYASDLATRLLVEIAGAQVVGPLNMVEPVKASTRTVPVRRKMIHRMVSIDLPDKEIEKIFHGLGFNIKERGKEATGKPEGNSNHSTQSWLLEIPSFRLDMLEEVDVLEEIVRVYGIDKLPANPIQARWIKLLNPSRYFDVQQIRETVRDLGFDEVENYTLVSVKEAQTIHGEAFSEDQVLANPLNADMDALRADLFMGMTRTLTGNHAQRNLSLELFEIGRVFEGQKEATHLGLALGGKAKHSGWEGVERSYDFFDLKGRLTKLFNELNVTGIRWEKAEHKAFSLFITLYKDQEEIGFIGQVSKGLLESKKIEGDVCFAEVDLDLLLKTASPKDKFAPLPQFPTIQRDLALIVPEETPFDEVSKVLEEIASKAARTRSICLDNLTFFDIFRSNQIGEGRKSMAFRFVYRSLEKTLTDSEVNLVHQEVLKQAGQRLGCEVRV